MLLVPRLRNVFLSFVSVSVGVRSMLEATLSGVFRDMGSVLISCAETQVGGELLVFVVKTLSAGFRKDS